MSEETKEAHSEQATDGLDFKEAQNMTVGEAVRKDSEIKAGVTEDDGVLDKYIKQHREEVVSQKFESKASDFEDLDTSTLDSFIQKQREELAQTGLIDLDEVSTSESSEQAVNSEKEDEQSVDDLAETIVADNSEQGTPVTSVSSVFAGELVEGSQKTETDEDSSAIALGEDESTPIYKHKGVLIGGLIALIVAIFGIAYGMNSLQSNSSKTTATSTKKSSTSSSSTSTAKKDNQSFEDLYATFFTDDEQTALKNDSFDSLSNLEAALQKLEGTDYYDDAKEKYDSLNKQIAAIQAVNDLFESDVIVNGEKMSVAVKSDADFDSLSSSVSNTGNATLDTLIQSAITDGKSQLEALASSASSSQAEAAAASQTEAETSTSDSSSSTSSTTTVSGASGYGITSYDTSSLQRDKTRVPYNDSAIADSSNSAWTFADGVLDKIVATSQARGYFSGNDYILEKVNIINGNGYYNMFKSDGTYLFSINCKTGYYVGNASGNSDALDY